MGREEKKKLSRLADFLSKATQKQSEALQRVTES